MRRSALNPDEDLRLLEREGPSYRLALARHRYGLDGIPLDQAVKIVIEFKRWTNAGRGSKVPALAERWGIFNLRGQRVDRDFWVADLVDRLLALLTEPSRVVIGQWVYALFPRMTGAYLDEPAAELGAFQGYVKLADKALVDDDPQGHRVVTLSYFGIEWQAVFDHRSRGYDYDLYMNQKHIGRAGDPHNLYGWAYAEWTRPKLGIATGFIEPIIDALGVAAARV